MTNNISDFPSLDAVQTPVNNDPDNKATFVVQIQYRQNSTWQGQVLWKEASEHRYFRSELELIKLIDNAAKDHIL